MSVFLYVFGLLVSFLLGGICVERKIKEKQQSKVNIGEALVSNKLNDYLFHEQIAGIVVNNVTLSIDGTTTQIDHILICTKGVFVIETKHYSGWIYGDVKQKQWMQVLFKKRSQFQNPIHQNYRHIKAIQALFDFVPTDQIKSLVVFTGDGEFKTSRPKDVVLLDGIKDWMNQHEKPCIHT
ncbi:nuclease-related domain-containing protein [Photobacterium kishitanii]|uniref:nuclease-related domain-containing protein n=1 Tax=Photobacterium kishitanii TaxID=318456 RepID=UPI00273925E0|nr:nuclease-related domain-containing protein [Photobacterium kishitanii]